MFARLKIRVVVIPPHTSHGLAACDQFNIRLHQRRGFHETQMYADGVVNVNLSMRMEALVNGIEDISRLYDEVAHSFVRAGISQSRRSVDLLANKPRNSSRVAVATSPPLSQPIFTSDDDLPPVFQLPSSRTSKAALLEQMEAMQAAFLERENTLRVQLAEALSDNAKLASEQQAIVLARL